MWNPFIKKEPPRFEYIEPEYQEKKCTLCGESIKYPNYLTTKQIRDDLVEKGWIDEALPTCNQTFYLYYGIGGMSKQWRFCPGCQRKLRTFLTGKVDWVKKEKK